MHMGTVSLKHTHTHTMWMYNIKSLEGSGIILFLVALRDKQEMLSAAVSYSALSASSRHLSAKNHVYMLWNALRFQKLITASN